MPIEGLPQSVNRAAHVPSTPLPLIGRKTDPRRRAGHVGLYICLFSVSHFGRMAGQSSKGVSGA
eukprot:8426702-Lingulodinium_polyedra.AAC.1